VLRQLDPNVPMVSARTMEAQLDQSLLNDRLVATLSAAVRRRSRRCLP
jgi:hypothetical protein